MFFEAPARSGAVTSTGMAAVETIVQSAPGSAPEAADEEQFAPADPDLPPLPARVKSKQHAPRETTLRTTMLLQKIPKKCTRALLEKRLTEGQFMEEIDFLYLPVDLKSKSNVGQCILNFRTEEACTRFSEGFHKKDIKQAFPGLGGSGLCSVTFAKDQGKDANVLKLQKSTLLMSMLASMPEWLPQIFDEQGQAIDFPEQAK